MARLFKKFAEMDDRMTAYKKEERKTSKFSQMGFFEPKKSCYERFWPKILGGMPEQRSVWIRQAAVKAAILTDAVMRRIFGELIL